jgi:hypothetical protein
MHEPSTLPANENEPSLASELAAIPYEPLLPVEKKLIVGSLMLGVLLLGLLLWISANYFPVASPRPHHDEAGHGWKSKGDVESAPLWLARVIA